MKNPTASVILAACLAFAANAAVAGDFKLPTLGNSKTASAGNSDAMQTTLVQRYVASSTSIDTALVELALAYGLKDHAAALQGEITALQSGSVNDKKGFKKSAQVSDAALAAVQSKLDSGEQLSDEGKKHYIASLPHYFAGVKLARSAVDDGKSFLDSSKTEIAGASMLEAPRLVSKFSTGTYLAGETPGYLNRTLTGAREIVSYAQKNQIPVPKDATSLLD